MGYAFLATLRKDGDPRLHPVSIVIYNDHLYVFIPVTSPKCIDLLRDGRYTLQAFPSVSNDENEELFKSGYADQIQDLERRKLLIEKTKVSVEQDEVLFELLVDRVMHTKLVDNGTSCERPIHCKRRELS